MDNQPIFIGGLDRTGKTLMRLTLTLHPNIIITKRTDLWVKYFDRFGDLGKPENYEKCVNALMTSKHIRGLKPDLNRLHSEFYRGQPSYERLFTLIYEQLVEREKKSRWGDQSELVEEYADPIFQAYPSAKMIHMIRDPRDRYSASKMKWTTGKGKVGAATAKWVYSARLAQHNQKKYPGKYLIVRYEDLINDPARMIETVCTFLDEEFYPSMLLIGHIRGMEEDIVLPEMPQQNHFLKNFVGEYRFNLSKLDISFIQNLFPGYMHSFGYDLMPVRLSTYEKAIYGGKHFPKNLGNFAMWFAMQSLNISNSSMNSRKSKNIRGRQVEKQRHGKMGEINYER